MQEYLLIGTVLKPQGIRGEVKIKPYAARVEMFSSWKNLFLCVCAPLWQRVP